MNLLSHIEALHEKHTILEEAIQSENLRPLPDFVAIADLKKRKLRIKEELEKMEHALPAQRQAS